ncbi:MAG TPA: hypothetical protein VMU82_12290 [Acetobacteraceae bacterium]|nr:hypothetical protein [Acetobacteraceae bacterium]
MSPKEPDDDFTKVRAEFDRFREELAEMKAAMASIIAQAKEDFRPGSDAMSSLKTGVEHRIAALEGELEKLAGNMQDRGREAMNQVGARVQERPLTALAIAFGVGLIGAQLLRR